MRLVRLLLSYRLQPHQDTLHLTIGGSCVDEVKILRQPESTLARVSQQLSHLEKRDWELWAIVCLTSVLVGVGLITILSLSAFLKRDSFHFEITVSRQLVVGLAALLVLLNIYMVTKRLDLRRMRENLISTTIQSELVRLQSFTDPLTEVYNRRSLDDMAGRFISQARRSHKPLTFLLIDVDRFKEVNTRFGHLGGDMVLAEIATLLKSSTRGSDAVVRYGGDEFVIILSDTSCADRVVERIRAYLRDWNQAGQLDNFELSLSIGVAEWSDGQTLDEVLDIADRDMYSAKAASKVARGTE